MIIWTGQHKTVLDTLLQNGEYFADDELVHSKVSSERLESYRILREKINFPTPIIWGMNKRVGIDLTDLEFNEENLKNIDFRSVGCSNDDVFLKLEVPREEVVLTAYYEWTDFLFFREEERDSNFEIIEKCFNSMFEIDNDVDDIQVLLPKIKKEWIVSIIDNVKAGY